MKAGRIIHWTLGGLLLAAAVLKGHELATGPLVGEGLWANRWLMATAVVVEALMGLWLVSGLYPTFASRCGAGFFLLFAVFALDKAVRGAHSCGCFGRVPVNPWITLTLDVAALGALAWTMKMRNGECGMRIADCGSRHLWRVWAGVVVLGVAAAGFLKMTVFHAEAGPDRKLQVLDSGAWVGGPWPIGSYVDAWPQLARGRWAVLLYNWPCGHCGETIKDYADLAGQWQAQGKQARVALIETGGEALPESMSQDLVKTPALRGQLRGPVEWFITSPTVVVLDEGRVVAAAEGDEDCQWDEGKLGRW